MATASQQSKDSIVQYSIEYSKGNDMSFTTSLAQHTMPMPEKLALADSECSTTVVNQQGGAALQVL